MSTLKRTPLFPLYERYNARLVDFGGWELPVQYSGIKDEHLAVRNNVGVFDVSHMGEIRIRGKGALPFLQYALANDAERLRKGSAQYTALLNHQAGFIDDLFIYRLEEDEFLLCVNAANIETDYEWLSSLPRTDCEISDESDRWALIAVQGPRAEETLFRAAGTDPSTIMHNKIAPLEVDGANLLASRTGYTGEDGFELFVAPEDAVRVWDIIMDSGEECGVLPCGLGARDTLRLEMGHPLHGHDITPETTPLEASLEWIAAAYKKDFVGKQVLSEQKHKGVSRKRAGLFMEEPGVAREGCRIVTKSGEGVVTSGTKTPSLEAPVAMGYVPPDQSEEDTEIKVEIRGRQKKARIAKWPFYKDTGKTELGCT
ncbi:MAG: glycine cleavage system aminomethyltransferase GcvT [bacterium]